MRTCARCGTPINLAREGAKVCSTRCRVALHRAAKRGGLPAEMTSQDRWVRYDAKKAPRTVDGGYASSTKSGTWSSYTDARQSTVGAGVGFVLGGGIGCIDLDHCIVDGELQPWAAEIVAEHKPSALLIEVSRSGEGVHIFTYMPEGHGSVVRDHRNIETYPPNSGRYIAVTGDRLTV